jgi:hypothetical protein
MDTVGALEVVPFDTAGLLIFVLGDTEDDAEPADGVGVYEDIGLGVEAIDVGFDGIGVDVVEKTDPAVGVEAGVGELEV